MRDEGWWNGGLDDVPELPLPPERRALQQLVELRAGLQRLEDRLVERARLLGYSWSELAPDLGLTKGGIYRRHAHHDPIAARQPAERPSHPGPG
jgi:hypothetical protein